MAGLTIKAVSERTGVPLHTLRAWERRYGVPLPKRQPENRYRLYDEEDIADVLWMKRQLEAGMSPAQASVLLRQQPRHQPGAAQAGAASLPLTDLQSHFLAALLKSDEVQASGLLNQAFALFTSEQVAMQIIQPAMREVGEQWLINRIAPWQEHLASNLVRQKLLAILQSQPDLAVPGREMVAACAPEEQHELGLLVLSLLARRAGWNVLYLGQRTPLADLQALAPQKKIVITVTTVTGLASLIPLWTEANRPAAPLVFGGKLFNQLPRLQAHVPGTYLGADTAQAVRKLEFVAAGTATWAPAREALIAAETLQAERLPVAARTLQRLNVSAAHARETHPSPLLSAPTLFLIDALSSALAFEVPELLDTQGAWLRVLLAARGIEPIALEHYLEAFERVSAQVLAKSAAVPVKDLLSRLAAAARNE